MTNDTMTVRLSEVDISDNRARDLDPAWASALASIIAAQGLTNPITIRPHGDRYHLVTGLHRLEAFKLNGEAEIPARLSSAKTDDEARLEEVMENLGRNELIALDRCHHLAALKDVYERMYPQAKNGGDRKSEEIRTKTFRSDPDGAEAPEIFGFAKATAAKIGLTQRAIQIAVKIWTDLSPVTRQRLRGTDLAAKQTELKALSELKPAQQTKVLDLILSEDHPAIQNVEAARVFLEGGIQPSAFEKRYRVISEGIKELSDEAFDRLLIENEARVMSSLKRRGSI